LRFKLRPYTMESQRGLHVPQTSQQRRQQQALVVEVDKRARDAAHAAAVHFGLYFARCESSALAGDHATWTRRERGMVLNDRCIATWRAVRNVDDTQRIDAAVRACDTAAAAAAAAGEPPLRIEALRILRNVVTPYIHSPRASSTTFHRERETLPRVQGGTF